VTLLRLYFSCSKLVTVFFVWDDKEMVAFEKRLMERINATEHALRAEIARLEMELAKLKAYF
jgi:hypothetical protein